MKPVLEIVPCGVISSSSSREVGPFMQEKLAQSSRMAGQELVVRRAGLRPPVGQRKGRRQDFVEIGCDGGLWEGLPEELVEHVLTFLPVPSLLRASSVCKKWNALVSSIQFKERCSQVPPQRPWLVTMAEGNVCQAYSPGENKWCKLPWAELSGGILVAGGPGLLCFQTPCRNFREVLLVVVNPVSKYVKLLPPCVRLGWGTTIALEVVENSFPLAYRVLVFFCILGNEGQPVVIIRIFDSTSDCWRLSASSCPVLGGSSVLDLAVSAGSVYCVIRSSSRDHVMAYNIRQDLWTVVDTPNVPSRCFYRLLDCQGHLMLLVGRLGIDGSARESDRTARVCVYRMESVTGEWQELDHMPARIRHRLIKGEVSECAGGSKGEIYLAANSRRSEFVKYDEADRSWTPLPTCPELRNVANLQVVSFVPRWGS